MAKTLRTTSVSCMLWAAVTPFSITSTIFAASPSQAPPLAPGMGRVWFLEDIVPGGSFYAPMIDVNGAKVAISPEGSAFFRDYPPGTYVFSVENCVPERQTSQQLTIASGQQFALQVQTDDDVAFDWNVYYLSQVQAAKRADDVCPTQIPPAGNNLRLSERNANSLYVP